MSVAAAKPSGHTAVMASRAPIVPGELDYFPPPPWAARAGGELIKTLDPHAETCWEPAAGGGHMVHGLQTYFRGGVASSDIHPFGTCAVIDFLGPKAREVRTADWIVTNPPFRDGEAFVRQAWPLARRGVAMLLRSVFLEGVARHALFTRDCPLSCFAQFAERVPMVKGRWDPDASSATAYGWFIWLKPETGLAPLAPLLKWIAPGAKARLSRDSDRRFLDEGPGLFDEAAP